MRHWFVFAIATMGFLASAQDIAIVGARIEVGNGKVLDKGTILIQGGKIVSIGKDIRVPTGVPQLEASGLFAYPGFVDGYSTKGLKLPAAPEAAPAPNVLTTAPATMWEMNRKGIRSRINAADCLDLASMIPDAHKAGITSGLLAPGSGLARGRTTFAYFTDEKVAAMPAAIELSFRGTGGGGPGGGGGGGAQSTGYNYPGTLLGFTALLRQTLADAKTYSMTPGVKEDLDLKGLVPLIKGEATGIVSVDTEPDIYRALKLSEEFGFPFAIAGGRDAYKRSGQLAKAGVPVLANISIGSEPSTNAAPDGPPKAILEERKALWQERALNVQKLIEAGVRVAFSSESSGFGDYLANIRTLIKLGLPKKEALRSMTSVPAQVLGMEKEVGSLEVGKLGNVVLMSGDFADEKSIVKIVVVLGKKFEVDK